MSKFKFQLGLLSLNNMIMHITANYGNEVMGTSLYASILSLLAIDAKYLLNLSARALLQTICSLSIIKDALISCFPLPLISFIIFQVFFLLPLNFSNLAA